MWQKVTNISPSVYGKTFVKCQRWYNALESESQAYRYICWVSWRSAIAQCGIGSAGTNISVKPPKIMSKSCQNFKMQTQRTNDEIVGRCWFRCEYCDSHHVPTRQRAHFKFQFRLFEMLFGALAFRCKIISTQRTEHKTTTTFFTFFAEELLEKKYSRKELFLDRIGLQWKSPPFRLLWTMQARRIKTERNLHNLAARQLLINHFKCE